MEEIKEISFDVKKQWFACEDNRRTDRVGTTEKGFKKEQPLEQTIRRNSRYYGNRGIRF